MSEESVEGSMRGWWSGHKVVDPVELERRFANEDGLSFMDAVFYDEISEEGQERLVRVQGTLEFLPPTEADFVDLYYFKHLKQTDIATIFGVSQPTVCYRLQRAALRIQFLLALPSLEADELETAMVEFLDDPLDAEIMLLMHRTTCQSEVGKQLGVTQGFVRHRFIRSIRKMRQALEHREEVVAMAEDAVDLLTAWGALDTLAADDVDEVLVLMAEQGALRPTDIELRVAHQLLVEQKLEALRLNGLFGSEEAEEDPGAEPPEVEVEFEEVAKLAQELRVNEARNAVLAIEAREQQEAADLLDLDKYLTIFTAISENLNILREVQRPSWGDKVVLVVH
jgi:DNA-directed RNA polymerase specialized sigma24 family protein